MATIIDRRDQPKGRGMTSRQRFLRRYKGDIKDAVDRSIGDKGIKDIGDGGIDVTPRGGTKEPFIHHGKGGRNKHVVPGNKQYDAGDRIPRPQGGGGGGGKKGSPDGEGEDDFTFHITEDEVLNQIFDDLELPNMTKKGMFDSKKTRPQRRGFVSQGPFNKLDLQRSKKKKMGRKLAAESPYNKKILALLEQERDIFLKYSKMPGSLTSAFPTLDYETKSRKIKNLKAEINVLKGLYGSDLSEADASKVEEIDAEVAKLESGKNRIPKWVESTDLQFRNHVQVPVPTEKAVMFCLMDVSGSMSQDDKDKAKLFFFLLYKFLERNYDQTDVVFIRHHSDAKEVDEQEFFYGRETGGTVVSTALNLMQDIVDERYPLDQWNIYGAQASDGDNFPHDLDPTQSAIKGLLDLSQAYFYTEIVNRDRGGQSPLWEAYEEVRGKYQDQFFMGEIEERKDIYPVFRKFFEKRNQGPQPSSSQKRSAGLNFG